MLKSISLVILSFSLLATANAVANPLALFVEQCLQYSPNLSALAQQSPDKAAINAVEFEKQTLALNNINDRIQYYRPFANDNLSKQGLLWCQLHLADELYALNTSNNTQQLIESMHLLESPYNQLAQRLENIQQTQWDLIEKSKLHSAQATVDQALSTRQLQIKFNSTECELTPQTHDHTQEQSQQSNINIHIAKYLHQQTNEQCRQKAWFAYQLRAKSKVHSALNVIHQLHQQRAQDKGYNNAAQLMLANSQLSPTNLKEFLDTQTASFSVAPWNLAQALSRTEKSPTITPVATKDYLARLLSQLSVFGIHTDLIKDSAIQTAELTQNTGEQKQHTQILRIWHHQRLLGEIYTYPHTSQEQQLHVKGQLIRQSVIGHQFGQYALSFPIQLTQQKQQKQLIDELSQAIVSLSQGGQFYLLTHKTQNQQHHAIASMWLSHYLTQFQHFAPPSEREKLIQNYQTQMRVFKSKVALAFYQHSRSINDLEWLTLKDDLSLAFTQGFGQPWPNATDTIYSFQAIANQGISYYLPLWQDAVAKLIINQASSTFSAVEIFNILVVNEAYLSFNDQLEQLIGAPIDPHSLIWRIKHVATAQE
ncbi:hypothetical protein [Shewanella inventionis]|uniref:Zn-dependent oligopeptidase n=1 Tax=Shewanella inventionis TaxID=1738770 RepID=A0ABQ1IQU0_9GAMM|nr:hypothetical protein [Shewanella inventionis]MCL1157224.1 hypothetical protein [Shewanella inventionis]GGB48906.1 Zn-dependent oligopeptidase [Shewanella inventionis]